MHEHIHIHTIFENNITTQTCKTILLIVSLDEKK